GFHVTGVQTCALPIYVIAGEFPGPLPDLAVLPEAVPTVIEAALPGDLERPEVGALHHLLDLLHGSGELFQGRDGGLDGGDIELRSEERRVGKGARDGM